MFGTHSIHLSGGETVATTQGSNHDAIRVAATANASSLGIVLGHSIPAADRVEFLHALADAAVGLAATIMQREPQPIVSEYHCRLCDARFGIAGTFTGSDDDYAAEEYHRAEVERHESGECAPGAALAERHMAEAMAKAGIGGAR